MSQILVTANAQLVEKLASFLTHAAIAESYTKTSKKRSTAATPRKKSQHGNVRYVTNYTWIN